jgi:Fic family protein
MACGVLNCPATALKYNAVALGPMSSFRNHKLRDLTLPTSTAWLIADIAEAKGKQELYTRQSPQVLKALRDTAIVQSAESSNRIEGVTVDRDRLRPLVLGHARPRDRSEEEVLGYRRALNVIHSKAKELAIIPGTLKRLHALCQEGSGDAGQYKRVDNDIIELVPGEAPKIRFKCVPATQTATAVEELCLLYRHSIDQERVLPLIAAGALVLDFTCIHPFRDGNGRVSRLLTLLALYHTGHEVGRYVSLERLTEESKEDYYEALHRSSQLWHEGKHDLVPWLNLFLAIIRRACNEFEQRAGQIKSPRGAKTELLDQAISGLDGDFTLSELEKLCPGVSREMIRHRLKTLKTEGAVEAIGRGPGAKWRKRGNNRKRG